MAPATADLRDSDVVRTAIALGRAHVTAETTNDLEQILDTVSDTPWFPLLDHDGRGGVALDLRATPASVREYYANRGTTYDIVASQHVHALSSDWYYFRESVATLRHVGEVAGVAPTGDEFQVNSAVLFPVAEDGIGGEIVWTRYPFGNVLTGRAQPPPPVPGPAHLPNRQLRTARAHDAYVAVLRGGDATVLADCLAPDAQWLGRRWSVDGEVSLHVHQGRDAVAAGLTEDLRAAPVDEVELFNRIVTDWYVLAEYRLTFPSSHGIVERRLVALYPVDEDGRLLAEMSEARDVARGGP